MSDISAHGEWEGTEEHGLNEGESSQRSPTGPHENVISPIIPHLGLLNVSTGLPGPALIDHSPLQRMPSRGPDHDTESEESDSVPSIEATTVHAALALFSAYEGEHYPAVMCDTDRRRQDQFPGSGIPLAVAVGHLAVPQHSSSMPHSASARARYSHHSQSTGKGDAVSDAKLRL